MSVVGAAIRLVLTRTMLPSSTSPECCGAVWDCSCPVLDAPTERSTGRVRGGSDWANALILQTESSKTVGKKAPVNTVMIVLQIASKELHPMNQENDETRRSFNACPQIPQISQIKSRRKITRWGFGRSLRQLRVLVQFEDR